ncbi:ATPase [Candidatus Saccharibacteria bacterium]|nr:ATPase [Candidatus Saccharibacteria bacterium]
MSKTASKSVQVKKASGEYEPFSEEKVRASLKRVGVQKGVADDVIKILEKELYDGITTHEIYKHVFEHLRSRGVHLASKYNLKRAVMSLGPSGYPFEKFFAKILAEEGFKVKVGETVQGRCVDHEVDIVAQKGGKRYMVEAKFHNRTGLKTDTKVALYVYGRFLDISQADGFEEGWLVTNTRVTREARRYSSCVGIKVISWDYPQNFSLRYLVEKTGLYPVTALETLSQSDKQTLLEEDIVTCKELLKNLTLIPKSKRVKVKAEAQKICGDKAEK